MSALRPFDISRRLRTWDRGQAALQETTQGAIKLEFRVDELIPINGGVKP
ncbi:MAG: hypothetical protein WBD99_12860 [Thermodesulfobacteriota bacterium]